MTKDRSMLALFPDGGNRKLFIILQIFVAKVYKNYAKAKGIFTALLLTWPFVYILDSILINRDFSYSGILFLVQAFYLKGRSTDKSKQYYGITLACCYILTFWPALDRL